MDWQQVLVDKDRQNYELDPKIKLQKELIWNLLKYKHHLMDLTKESLKQHSKL